MHDLCVNQLQLITSTIAPIIIIMFMVINQILDTILFLLSFATIANAFSPR